MSKMLCDKCGNSISNDSAYCQFCGGKIAVKNLPTSSSIDNLLKRSFLFLEDGMFDKADAYLETVLDQDPENSSAYIGKLMVDLRVKTREKLGEIDKPFGNNGNYIKACRFGDPAIKDELDGYLKAIDERNKWTSEAKQEKNNIQNQESNYMGSGVVINTKVSSINLENKKKSNTKSKKTIISCALIFIAFATIIAYLLFFSPSADFVYSEVDGGIRIDKIKDTDITEITIPDKINGKPVIEIKNGAFQNCRQLTKVIIGTNVVTIGDYAFKNCINLKSIFIPKNVKNIGDPKNKINGAFNGAFYNCRKLGTVTFENNSELKYVGEYAFSHCESLVSVVLPYGVESVGGHAFSYCEALEKIVIPSSVAEVGQFILSDCNKIEEADIPAGVIDNLWSKDNLKTLTINSGDVDSSALQNCYSLQELTVSHGVTQITSGAFFGCKSLNEISLPSTIISVGGWAFYDTGYYNDNRNWEDGLLYIGDVLIEAKEINSYLFVIKEGTRLIADNVFNHFDNKITVNIPASVEFISSIAFEFNENINNFIVSTNNKKFKSVDGNIYSKDGNTLIRYAPGKDDKSFSISNFVTRIADYAFCYCDINSVTIPNSVVSIGNNAFYGCSNLYSVDIPNSVTDIGANAFATVLSGGIVYINIGSNVENIGYNAFGSKRLQSITVSSSNRHYKSVDGNLYSADGSTLIRYAQGKKVSSFVVPNSVKIIDEGAFQFCSNLESVSISNNVTTISKNAFLGCSFNSITIPESVTYLSRSAFDGCYNLNSVVFLNTQGWYEKYPSIIGDSTYETEVNVSDALSNAQKLSIGLEGEWIRK